jgi:hypothetical protein
MATEANTASQVEFQADPADLTTLGQEIRDSIKDVPAALQRFAGDGLANPSQFGTTGQDQDMGRTYERLCQNVRDLCPLLYDLIDSRGAAVQGWAHIFAVNDDASAQTIADTANGGR